MSAGAVVALLPSPLVGPAAWSPVASQLRDGGHEVVEVDASGPPPARAGDVRARFAAAVPPDRDVVVVPHSNAGAFVPGLIAVRPRIVGLAFVDAILPPRTGHVDLAPPGMLQHLGALATDGLLPPWTGWFDEADVAPLFPDAATRRVVEDAQPRLPLDYFSGRLAVPSGWDDRPGGYLAFGDTYAGERDDAASRGWAVVTMPGRHLHVLVDPAGVAAVLGSWLAAWTGSS